MSICGSAFGTDGGKVVLEKNEITDIKILYDKASNRDTDDPTDIKKFKAVLEGAPGYMVANKKVTTQKVREVEHADGSIESFYVTTTFADIKKPITLASTSNNLAWCLLAASKGWDEDDSSISWRHVGTFTYSSYRDPSTNLWVKPEKIDCKWYQLDSQVALTEGKYGMQWWGSNGSTFVGDSDYLYTPIPVSLGSNYSNTCKSVGGGGYINVTPIGCYVAGVQQSKLKRNTTTWTFKSDYLFGENM